MNLILLAFVLTSVAGADLVAKLHSDNAIKSEGMSWLDALMDADAVCLFQTQVKLSRMKMKKAGSMEHHIRKPVFFMHIHNAAGTWMRALAEKHHETPLTGKYLGENLPLEPSGDWNLYKEGWCNYEDPSNLKRCSEKVHAMKKEQSTFTSIERPFVLDNDWCPDDLLYVTIVREPIALMRSTLLNNHFDIEEVLALEKGDEPKMKYSGCLEGSMEQFHVPKMNRREHGYQHFDNFVTRSLNGYEIYALPYGEITRSHLDNAKQVLSKFDLVLDLEHLDAEKAKLYKMMGWDDSVIAEAKNTHDSPFEWTIEQQTMLKKANWADLELYEYALFISNSSQPRRMAKT